MSEISCDRSVLTAPQLSAEANNKTFLFPGTAGRMSNQFISYYDDGYVYEKIPPEQQVPSDEILANVTCINENMTAVHKSLLPKRLHYARHDRIDDIIYKMADRWQVDNNSPWCGIKGQHGFDPMYETMKASFLAYGPAFVQESQIEPFQNIELYNIMARVIDVPGKSNNGTEGSLYDILRSRPSPAPLEPKGTDRECPYPGTDAEYEERANLTVVGCQCDQPDENTPIRDYDDQLNFTESEKGALEQRHIPYGAPILTADDLDLCVLHQENHVTGYWTDARIATWTGFALVDGQGIPSTPDCRRPDVRVENQTVCEGEQDGVHQAFLFPPDWSESKEISMQALLLSNTVPMYTGFQQGIWSGLLTYISAQASSEGDVLVMLGPVWDHDNDGRRDADITLLPSAASGQPLPSHYFAILLRCPGDACADNYDPLAFILPHQPSIPECWSVEDYLFEHRARIRDVELLTDLQLFQPTVPAIKTRTFYPEELW